MSTAPSPHNNIADNSFKITLPSMSGMVRTKQEPGMVDLDGAPVLLPPMTSPVLLPPMSSSSAPVQAQPIMNRPSMQQTTQANTPRTTAASSFLSTPASAAHNSIPNVVKISLTPGKSNEQSSSNQSAERKQDNNKRSSVDISQPDLSSLLEEDDLLFGTASEWISKLESVEDNGETDPLKIDSSAVPEPSTSTSTASRPNTTTKSDNVTKTNSQKPMVTIDAASIDLGSLTDPNTVKMELGSLVAEKPGNNSDGNAKTVTKQKGVKKPRAGPKSAKKARGKKEAGGKNGQPSTPEMQGNNETEPGEGVGEDWCAVCHDGGDVLYCCDRCPKVYHLYCYIPPLTEEPPDDWVCLMCATYDELMAFPNKRKKGGGKMGDRDLKVCRRLLFELYNQYPESVTFRDCSDLNFDEYLETIKEPIALDVIKERLDKDNPEMYASIPEFLSDVRRMFRNCYTFHSSDSQFYGHAKTLEEFLDRKLQYWMPEFAYDTFENGIPTTAELMGVVAEKKGRATSPVAGPSSKKRKKSGSDKKKKHKKHKKHKKKNKKTDMSDNEESEEYSLDEDFSDEGSLSEGEKLDYLDDLEARLGSPDEEEEEADSSSKKSKKGKSKK